jgi:tRNA pseudouridine55 synthase
MEAEDFLNGQVILIDKPLKWTSFQVVKKIRGALKKRFKIRKIKVGHAGTLDPLATGLLIICTGKFTKKINQYQAETKEYTGTFTLGATTPSYDLETGIDQLFPTEHITDDLIISTAKEFLGETEQFPPMFSAIQKDGVRLYDLARKGESVEIKSRKTHIYEFEISRIELPEIDFRVICSKGTYIRSLAYDFGNNMNSGAYLSTLRRTKSGDFDVKEGISPNDFVESIFNEE